MRRFNRRDFLRRTSAAAAAAVASSPLRAADAPAPGSPGPATPPSTLPRVAFIGTGGAGGWHVSEMFKMGVNCPCYCDVDSSHMGEAARNWPKAKAYQDYREMFDKHHKEIDAVMVGVPDHHHYPASIIAMQLGKHIYTQKPVTHTVWEARKLVEAAAKYKVATQMGNQGHAGEGWRTAYEWVHGGALGDVKEVHTWTNRPVSVWPQGIPRPAGEESVPASLNWDVWIGPAPMRPFKKDVYHPFKWRGWWDFGGGTLGDMGCHTMDAVFAVLEPGYPAAVEPVEMKNANDETFPSSCVVKWEFPARGSRAAFVAYWYDAKAMPKRPPELEANRNLPPTGSLFIGAKATILISGDCCESARIIPEAKMQEIGKPPRMLDRSPGIFAEWFQALKGEKPLDFPKSRFAYAAAMTETLHLGNIALRVGKRIEWDGPNLKITNLSEANRYVSKEYRKGWLF